MPRARKHLVCLADTPYYHITSRCVRRAFLCGYDRDSGASYEHRRGWIENRIHVLASLFSIEICGYAVMSNHYHLIVKINARKPHGWSDNEVLERWTALFKGPLLVQRFRKGLPLTDVELDSLRSITAVFRSRLGSLSWFMKCLNEPIARKANSEDGCTGHFWEARFDSKALRSEKALLTAMTYVDLNPIRANLARTPETSDYTSIKARLQSGSCRDKLSAAVAELIASGDLNHFSVPLRPLMPFAAASARREISDRHFGDALPLREQDYLALVECTGRLSACGKRGRIDPRLVPILDRIGLSADDWAEAGTAFRQYYRNGEFASKETA